MGEAARLFLAQSTPWASSVAVVQLRPRLLAAPPITRRTVDEALLSTSLQCEQWHDRKRVRDAKCVRTTGTSLPCVCNATSLQSLDAFIMDRISVELSLYTAAE